MNEERSYTIVDLMRHGNCEGGRIFRGSTDVPLSETGWQQMRTAVEQHRGWNKIICSPMQRCRLFAQDQAQAYNIPVEIIDEWREIDFGVWEGKKIEEVWKHQEPLVRRYFADPGSVTPEGGESVLAAKDRVVNAFNSLVVENKYQHILVVQHGGTIRLLLTHLLSSALRAINRFEINYAAMIRVHIYHHTDEDLPVLVHYRPGFSGKQIL